MIEEMLVVTSGKRLYFLVASITCPYSDRLS